MVKIFHIKRQRCISDILNIIKKYNINISEITTSYINNYNLKFSKEEKKLQCSTYIDFLNIDNLLNKKNINEDYVFI